MRTTNQLLSLAAIVLSLFVSGGPTHAQFPNEGSDEVTFAFPGGTLKDYVALARKTFNDIQVIMAPVIEGVKLDPVEFKGSTSGSAVISSVPYLAHGQLNITFTSVGGGGGGRGANMLYRITAPPATTQVFSVRDFISRGLVDNATHRENADDKPRKSREEAMKALISAVEAALDISSQTVPTVKIKLHPDTGLLLVAGTEEQVDIIEQVVSQLQTGEEENIQELRAQVEALEQKVRELQFELSKRRQFHP